MSGLQALYLSSSDDLESEDKIRPKKTVLGQLVENFWSTAFKSTAIGRNDCLDDCVLVEWE